MKCTRIYYEKCFNLGNYQNEKVGVEIELAEGETAAAAMKLAQKFVEQSTTKENHNLDRAKQIVAQPDNYSYSDVVKAKEQIASQPKEDDLPF